jgi:hypothetical protein
MAELIFKKLYQMVMKLIFMSRVSQKNTNPKVGISFLVGPPGLEPGTKGL